MANGKDKNYISVWSWMFLLLITALPCIGVIMIVVLAFTGENESRKNYFRAIIAWFLILIGIWTLILLLGFWPDIQKQLHAWFPQWK